MSYTINAWLDCRNPYIAVHNRETGDMLAYFNEREVRRIFSAGEVILDDFCFSDEASMTAVAEDLLLVKWGKSIKTQISSMQAKLKKRAVSDKKNSRAMDLVFPDGFLGV